MGRIVPWDAGIIARWYRANELIGLSHPPLVIDLVEEETEQNWRLTFDCWQAYRVTSEECHWPFNLMDLPEERGGFFEVLDSAWIRSLGKDEVGFLANSRHFIICCYDDIIEVVAHGCQVTKLERVGYPAGRGRVRVDPLTTDEQGTCHRL